MLPQPPPVIIAMVLFALLSLTNLQVALGSLEGKPTAAVFLPVVVGVLGLGGAGALWMLKRGTPWLVIIVNVGSLGVDRVYVLSGWLVKRCVLCDS